MNPKVTVYITNYNYGKYIKEAIESVLYQSEQNFELIIIDDGSIDESKKIIEQFSGHQKTTIIYQQNKGLNVSNNIAMRTARGKYIVRLDADDYFHKDALKYLIAALDEDDSIGLVFPDYYNIDSENNIISEIKRHDFAEDVTLYDQPAHGACTMIRVEYLKKIGGYDESFSCQDGYDLWIKFTSEFKVKNINKPLFYYRQHSSNLTKNENRLLDTRIEMKKKFLETRSNKLPDTVIIIPVRSLHISRLCFEKINEKTLIEKKIESALESELAKKIIITASDEEVFYFIKSKFFDERIMCISRPREFSRYNSSLLDTIKLIFNNNTIRIIQPDSFVLLSLEFPFLQSKMIDNSIRSSVIFNADTVISVRVDYSSFYKHNGSTMLPLFDTSFTKYERDDLYVAKGGLTYSSYKNLLRNKKLPSGKISHIIIDQMSALEIKTTIDLSIAACLENQNSKLTFNSIRV